MKNSPSNLIRSLFLVSTILLLHLSLSSARVSVSGGDVEERVKKIVVEHLSVSAEQVGPDTNFKDDLGADDLDMAELIMAFEEEFGIQIPEEDEDKLTTLHATTQYIESRCSAACRP